jgi:diguanylate cyclase (GGDEF)-like protein/PAS domain S-box-containing protein
MSGDIARKISGLITGQWLHLVGKHNQPTGVIKKIINVPSKKQCGGQIKYSTGFRPIVRVAPTEITEPDQPPGKHQLFADEQILADEMDRAQLMLEAMGDAVLATDISGKITYMNPLAEAMTGWSRSEALGLPLLQVFQINDAETGQAAENPALRAIKANHAVNLLKDCVLIRKDGFTLHIEDSCAPVHNRKGEITGAVMVFRDVSRSRSMTAMLVRLAEHDLLTELPNRRRLKDRLLQALGLNQRSHKRGAVLFLDLDHFKKINDSLGHTTGDKLLQSIALRLSSCVRCTDTVSRHGGDEFVILLPEIERTQDAAQVALKLRDAFALPHDIDGKELYVTLSIGISIFPDDGLVADTLIKNADTAMYHAKKCGRKHHKFFKAGMDARTN